MGKKHPLDIFRASGAGFDSATRERRTVIGRVVASAPRAAAAPNGVPPDSGGAAVTAPVPVPGSLGSLPPAVAAMRARVMGPSASASGIERVEDPAAFTRPLRPPLAPRTPSPEAAAAPAPAAPPAAPARPAPRMEKAPPKPAPKAPAKMPAKMPAKADGAPRRTGPAAVNRMLLASACVLVGSLALWTLFASAGGPPLKSEVPVAGAASFRVQAAVYPGTPSGQTAAFDARDWLLGQGYADVDVVAWQTDKGEVSRFDLVVGRSASEAGLADVLGRLHDLRNWPGTPKAPFKDAFVVPSR